MLKLLVDYARDQGLDVEPGFKRKAVRWLFVHGSDGRFLEVQEMGDTTLKRNPGRDFLKCPDLSQPELVGGNEPKSHFLVETAEVVALIGSGGGEPKARQKHAYFVRLLRDAAPAMP